MRCAKCGSEHITLDSFAGNALVVYQCHECGWRTAGSDPAALVKDFSQTSFGCDLEKVSDSEKVSRWNRFREEVEAIKQQKLNLKCPWCGREIKSFHTMDYVTGQGWNEIGGIFECRRCEARLQSDQGYNTQATYLELISPGKLYCKPMAIFTKSEQKGKKMSRADNKEIEAQVATQVEIAELKSQLKTIGVESMNNEKENQRIYNAKVQTLTVEHEAEIRKLQWHLENVTVAEVATAHSLVHQLEMDKAQLTIEKEMLEKMLDLNGDIVDVKELVTKIIDKLPEFKISNLTITPSVVPDK